MEEGISAADLETTQLSGAVPVPLPHSVPQTAAGLIDNQELGQISTNCKALLLAVNGGRAVMIEAWTRYLGDNDVDRDDAYRIYCLLHGTRMDFTRRNAILTQLVGAAAPETHWRVVGISPAALAACATINYRKPPRQLDRAHLQQRAATARYVFDRPDPLPMNAFFDEIAARDMTVLSTKAENASRTPPRYIPFDPAPAPGLFAAQPVGWRHEQAEAAYLQQLHADFQAGRVQLVDPAALQTKATPRVENRQKTSSRVVRHNIAEGVRASWRDPEVAAKRRLRHSVTANGAPFQSVAEAFRQLHLPMNMHQQFRLRLKQHGALREFDIDWQLRPPLQTGRHV